MDLINKYISGSSPYIDKLTYDLDEREVIIVFLKKTYNSNSVMRLIFRDVLSFAEEMFEDALEDNLTDSIMGMHMVSDNVYCVKTEKRELLLKVGLEPISEHIPLSTQIS